MTQRSYCALCGLPVWEKRYCDKCKQVVIERLDSDAPLFSGAPIVYMAALFVGMGLVVLTGALTYALLG